MFDTLNVYLFKAFRPIYNKKLQKRLKNSNFSIISINCLGGIISHDLNQRFLSPFINLWMQPADFVKLCQNLEYYMSVELKDFTTEEGIDYPIGVIDGMKLYFQHYESEEEAAKKWNERRARVNYDNMYFILQERENTSIETLKAFDELPYEHKIMFTHKPYDGLKNVYYMKGFENDNGAMNLLHVVSPIKRRVDEFDFVEWFNIL